MQGIQPPSNRPTQKNISETSRPEPAVDETIMLDDQPAQDKTKKRLPRRPRPSEWSMDWWRAWSVKRQIITLIVVGVLLIGGTGLAAWSFFWRASEPSLTITKHKKPAPITVASPLTGLQVDPTLVARPVTGIMIENSPFARPQSGIQDAGVIFEAIAEGGITRFMTLYQDAQPQYIGPVRSLRPYFLDFAAAYQASIVHVGGSPDALAEVRNGSYRDLDQFFNSGYFTRVSSRPAPHNVYTNFANLDKLNQSKGYLSSKYTPWVRKKDKKLVVPTAKTIDFTISSPDYYVHYDYDSASNTYLRSEGGAPHKATTSAADATGAQLHPNVVIAVVMSFSISGDGQHSVYGDTGSGAAYIFQDGGITVGQWSKANQGTMITFSDAKGAAVKLNAGQTWITLVSGPEKVSYTAPPPPAAPAKKQ